MPSGPVFKNIYLEVAKSYAFYARGFLLLPFSQVKSFPRRAAVPSLFEMHTFFVVVQEQFRRDRITRVILWIGT
jgi:hypothetical protein